MSIFNSENIENYFPKCCKIALFALKFKKISGGACTPPPPPPPPREVPPWAVALSVPKKNPFSQNLIGSTDLLPFTDMAKSILVRYVGHNYLDLLSLKMRKLYQSKVKLSGVPEVNLQFRTNCIPTQTIDYVPC